MLFVVIKKVHENGELAEDVAIKHNHEEAYSLLLECQQSHVLHGVEVSRLNMLAITGRIAEGLRKPPKKTPRISPELWN